MIPAVNVCGIRLFDGDNRQATEIMLASCSEGGMPNRLISATGAHGIVMGNQDPHFLSVLNSCYMNLPDGMPSVWVGRLKGARQIERCYGPDFFREVMVASRHMDLRHYFCGGNEGVAEELVHVCEQKFGNQNVVGVCSPPFRELTDEEIIHLANGINALNADVVWIGLSTPKQENLAFRLSKHTKVCFLCTVGAAFDFHTGRLKQAPHWMQRLALEWLFRLIVEPQRLWKRYWVIVPSFIRLSFSDLWRYFILSKHRKEAG